jgi:hypothetical protein
LRRRRWKPRSSWADLKPGGPDFFDDYVWQAQRLPITEYYAKLGITLIDAQEGSPVRFEQRLLREAWLGRKPRGAT